MSQVQNWSNVIQNVQNANLDKQSIQMTIKGINKRAYKEQLDREVQNKNYQLYLQNARKKRQLEEARFLAEAQRKAKLQSRQQRQQKQKSYGQQNQQLARLHHSLKSQSKQIQRRNIDSFLQHPFVKLVQGQDTRKQHLRDKFIKQNQINHLQEEMRQQERQANRYREMQEKNQFVEYVEQSHQKRSADREKFKNRYLRIRKTEELDPSHYANRQQDQSVEKMYVNYLNHQIKSNSQKRAKQKAQVIDDKRIQQFYSSGRVEPDSSPAFLGRNPFSYERRRQLYFINKHLNTHHQRSLSSNSPITNKTAFIPSLVAHRQQTKSNQYMKLSNQLNPEINKINFNKNSYLFQNKNHEHHNQSANIKPYPTQKQMFNQPQASESERLCVQRPQIYSTIKQNPKQVTQHSRRIKSELFEQSLAVPQKLPHIQKSLTLSQRDSKISQTSQSKKQYLRYDVISGKHVPFYT